MQYCICFTNPCISFLVPLSVTHEYHCEVPDLLSLLQHITAYFQTEYLSLSGAELVF